MEAFLMTHLAELTSHIEKDLAQKNLNPESLFDDYYQEEEEGRYRTSNVKYFESEVLPYIKKWNDEIDRIIYVVVMDRKGFMPTHILPQRARIRMEDPVSLKGAESEEIIGQAFRRPLEAGGEMVVDLAAPLRIVGSHWGCLRIGYLPE